MPAIFQAQREGVTSVEEAPRNSSRSRSSLLQTALLSFSALGIIYGDIGTSPLYVMNAIFPANGPVPSREDVIGAISAVIWSITIVAAIKYCLIALSFGNGTGEGGPFAVFTALYPPKEDADTNRIMTTYTTHSVDPHWTDSSSLLQKPWIKRILFSTVVFGTCLTMSDGLLTPAVSVVSAVGGMAVAVPSISNDIVAISCAILVVLFAGQVMGTTKVSRIFAPVVTIWLLILAISGIVNLTSYPGIFRAFDPSRAILLFVRTGDFDLLSGVLLSITGVEALFANLGQFSPVSIRFSFLGMVYPALMLAYLGQGAKLVVDPAKALPNVFFNTIPGPVNGGFWWFTWIFAIMAAVVASQAMITATFSLVQQLSTMQVIPHLKIVHTADDRQGQIFVPSACFLMMIGTIGLVVGFGTDAGLTNAYGFAVSGVLIVTTSILAVAMVSLKKLPIVVAIAFFLAFGFVDGLFWGSSLKKVPHGAWFPLGMAVFLFMFFSFWAWAKGLETKFDSSHRQHLGNLIARQPSDAKDDDDAPVESVSTLPKSVETVPAYSMRTLQFTDGSAALTRLPVFALFHNTAGQINLNGAPHAFSSFLRCYPSLPEVTIFFTIRIVGVPHTSEEERYVVSRIRSFEGTYTATLRLGYRDPIDLSNIAGPLRERIVALEMSGHPDSAAADVRSRVERIDGALRTAVTHFLPHFYVSAEREGHRKWAFYVRRFFIESVYRRLKVNFDETDSYKFEHEEQVLRMGIAAAL